MYITLVSPSLELLRNTLPTVLWIPFVFAPLHALVLCTLPINIVVWICDYVRRMRLGP